MLVLTQKLGQSTQIGGGIIIKVLDVRPNRIHLGIDAPLSVRVQREQHRRACEREGFGDVIPFELPTEIY